MTIPETFVLKTRQAARTHFTAVAGVPFCETQVTTDQSRRPLHADTSTFPDHETTKATTPQYAQRPASQAYLGKTVEVVVGQFFQTHAPNIGVRP